MTMKTIIKIIKQKLYDQKVVDVDTSGMKGLNGTLEIVVNETDDVSKEERKVFTGEHGSFDYLDEFGFMLSIKL